MARNKLIPLLLTFGTVALVAARFAFAEPAERFAFRYGGADDPPNPQIILDEDGNEKYVYDPEGFYKKMRHAQDEIVYAPEHDYKLWKRDGDIVVEGPALADGEDDVDGASEEEPTTGNNHLFKRDAALRDLPPPADHRRIIRRVAGCPSAPTFNISNTKLDNGAPFNITLRNVQANGIDFGNGDPQYFAFWKAELIDVNKGKTTTLTKVAYQEIKTHGLKFTGCFKTVNIPNKLYATLTQNPGKITPNVTGRYFVQATISPAMKSTRIAFQVTTTPYTFPTPTPTSGSGGKPTSKKPPLLTTAAKPEVTPVDCLNAPIMVNAGKYPAKFENMTAGGTVTVTLNNVKESIVSSTKGAKTTTWQAVYRAGEIATVFYPLITSGTRTVSDLKNAMTKTLSVGHPVTYRRTVTTPFSKLMGDGCILKLVDKTSWVIPKNATQGDKAVYGILGTVNGLPVRGVAMMKGVSTSLIPPYPTDKPVPTKPTVIPPTTTCGPFYAVAWPSILTVGQTATVQFHNIPATPVSLLAKGWSTVYQAKYAATLVSSGVAIATIPSKTLTTTVGHPTCIDVTATMVVSPSKGVPPITAAPSPTSVYAIRGQAQNYSDKPDGILPAKYAKVQYDGRIYINIPKTNNSSGGGGGGGGGTTPAVVQNYPCNVGPVRVKSRIVYNEDNAVAASMYKVTTEVVTIKTKRDSNHQSDEFEDLEHHHDEEPAANDDTTSSNDLHERGLTPNNNDIRKYQYEITKLTISVANGAGKISFIARDKVVPTLVWDLYNQNADLMPQPSDWTIEWTATGALRGKRLPPFSIISTYSADSTIWSGDIDSTANARNGRLNIVLTSNVTVVPSWTTEKEAAKQRVKFEVSAPNYAKDFKFQMTCCHPGAKKAAFTTSIFNLLKTEDLVPADLKNGGAGRAVWVINTSKKGSWKPTKKPILVPRYLGPVSELAQRFAKDWGTNGRVNEQNPNVPYKEVTRGPPTESELMKDLKDSFRDAD